MLSNILSDMLSDMLNTMLISMLIAMLSNIVMAMRIARIAANEMSGNPLTC